MARSFDGSTQYLSHAAAPIAGVPLSMAGWCFKTDAGVSGSMLSIGNSATAARFSMSYSSLEDTIAAAESDAEGTDFATSSGAGANNAWIHCAAVFRSATSRDAYRDGANKGSNTGTNTPLSLDRMFIGQHANSGAGVFFPGYLAEVGLWNIALSDADIADLAKGYPPPAVRRDGLVAYWRLFGRSSPEPDFWGRFDMTLVNAPTQIAHPRIIPIRRPKLVIHPAVVVAGSPWNYYAQAA